MFRYILNFLRDGSLHFPDELCTDLLREARFYNLRGIFGETSILVPFNNKNWYFILRRNMYSLGFVHVDME